MHRGRSDIDRWHGFHGLKMLEGNRFSYHRGCLIVRKWGNSLGSSRVDRVWKLGAQPVARAIGAAWGERHLGS